MAKAISEIVVAVMLLMIAVALIGSAFVFMSQFQGQAISSAQQSGTESLKRVGSCMQFVSFDGAANNIWIKNCGRYPIENVTVFIDSKPLASVPINANPNEIKSVAIAASLGVHEIKLESDYASVLASVIVTNTAPACADGTAYGQCSASKPLYCSSGTLVNKCSVCGCSGGTCQADESCLGGFDFSLFANPSSGSVNQGANILTTVTATLTSGTTQAVSLSCSGLPAGASCSFAPASASPTASSSLTILTAGTTPAGTYTVTITGTGGIARTTSYSLTVNAASVWFNSAWSYRKPITVTGSTSALSDYQALVTVDTSSLIAAGKMRTDCGDIRFTDSGELTSINYWVESGCNTATTKIWVKVPSIPTAGTTLYMYYGNSGAAAAGNMDVTFIASDLTVFTKIDPNNHLNVLNANTVSFTGLTTGERAYLYKSVPSVGDYRYDFAYSVTGGSSSPNNDGYVLPGGLADSAAVLNSVANGLYIRNYNCFHCGALRLYLTSSLSSAISIVPPGDNYVGTNSGYITITRIGTTVTMNVYSDAARTALVGTESGTVAPAIAFSYVIPISSYNIGMSATTSGTLQNLRVRKYASPEPSASVGAEQAK